MKIIAALLVSLLLFTSCNAPVKGKNGVEYKTAIQYNDYIVNKQSEVIKAILQFSQESQTDLSKAENTINSSIVMVDKSIDDLEGMPAWKENTQLRDNAIALFKFYKKTFSEDYKKIIASQKDGEISPEEETQNKEIVNRITTTEGQLDASFKAAQMDFASKNNMDVKKNDMQNKIDELNRKN